MTIKRNFRFQTMALILTLMSLLMVGENTYLANNLPKTIDATNLRIRSSTAAAKDADTNILHIVTTRFMQMQSDLVHLGAARLKLFETFCLPTMIQQQANNFLWFVMTDPNLDKTLLDRLKMLLDLYPHFYLVVSDAKLLTPSNLNQGIDDSKSFILTGDVPMLYSNMFDLHRPLLIETRLDADDGLERSTLLDIQRLAQELPSDTQGWQVICNSLHFEWRNNDILSVDVREVHSSGKVRLVREHICTTPGYSLVKHRNSNSIDFPAWPRMGHHLVTRDWPKCQHRSNNYNETHDCWIKLDPYPAALRSRTITSAGMSRVETAGEESVYENQTDYFWKVLEKDFGISSVDARHTSKYLRQNLESIVLDNLKGQCTFGHSCKDSSKEKLMSVLDLALIIKNGNVSST